MHTMSWDDLRFVLAVSEARSLAGAARDLGVDRTTVLRRVRAFERRAGRRLFERVNGVYELTPEASEVISSARIVDDAVTMMEQKLLGRDPRLDGKIRITTTDSLLHAVVLPHLTAFQRRYPRIVFDFVLTSSLLSIERREADIAIRTSPQASPNLVWQPLTRIVFGIYASPRYDNLNAIRDASTHRWLSVGDSLAGSFAGQWMKAHVPESCIYARADSFLALMDAAERGLGLAVIPTLVAASSRTLVRVENRLAEIPSTGLWAVTHPNIRQSGRVRAFLDHVVEALEKTDSPSAGTREKRRKPRASPRQGKTRDKASR